MYIDKSYSGHWPVLSPVALHIPTLVGDIRIAYTAAKNTNQGCHKQEA